MDGLLVMQLSILLVTDGAHDLGSFLKIDTLYRVRLFVLASRKSND